MIFCIEAIAGPDCKSYPDEYKPYFKLLSKLVTKRKNHMTRYFTEIRNRASDPAVLLQLRRYYELTAGNKTRGIKPGAGPLDAEIDRYFLSRLPEFYDMLFIDSSGFVFYSVRHESDYGTNIFKSGVAYSGLASSLKKSSAESYQDFEYYGPSDEPAAFFIYPCGSGRIVLQYPVNRINRIFSGDTGLSKTAETYLVNSDMLMLTDSRFISDSSILKTAVNTAQATDAFVTGKGHMVSPDYRGISVLSAYELFEYLGNKWVILAEMDEDEVLTEIFRHNIPKYYRALMSRAAGALCKSDSPAMPALTDHRVDTDDYAFAGASGFLFTKGIGPCTAVSICLPGRFSCLAHISPLDKMYHRDSFTGFFLGGRYTDIIDVIMKKIRTYNIMPYELNKIKIIITSVHDDGLLTLLDALVSEGLFLSSIKVACNPDADFANFAVSSASGAAEAEWVYKHNNKRSFSAENNIQSLGQIMKTLLSQGK